MTLGHEKYKIHKWYLHIKGLMKSIDKNESYTFYSFQTKALGLLFTLNENLFSFNLAKSKQTKVTKRSVIPAIALSNSTLSKY